MVKKEQVKLTDIFSEFKELKNIDRQTFVEVMEDSFRSVLAKMFGTSDNFDVILNPENGELEIYRNRTVVADDAEIKNPNLEVHLSEARNIDDECEIDEEVTDTVDFLSFGRRAILNLRQTLASKILELQKSALTERYQGLVGQIVTGELYQVWKKELLCLDEDGNELYMPKQEQIPSDFYRKGDMVRAIVQRVDVTNGNPRIILSRTSKEFLQRLFEHEVPEVHEGLITIRAIARIPGERAKVAVESYDDRIDPVGACVGIKGARIHGIVRELRNESIDVINYSSNTKLFIERAISPAHVSRIELDEASRQANLYMPSDEVSLAIGKGGYNIKLAGMLTGYNLDVFREDDITDNAEEDIYLDEFADEIDQWVIDAIKHSGLLTAKAVLRLSRDELIRRTDLEEETIDHVLDVLTAEFADDDEE